MTDFTSPLRARPLDSQTTVMAVDAAGTAAFSGDVAVSGRILQGLAAQAGTMMVTQSATVLESNTAATQLFSMPAAIIHDILYKRVNAGGFSTAVASIDIMIGTSGDDDALGRWANVSAQAALSFTEDGTNVCGLAMHSFATQGLFTKVTATSGAVSGALGVGHISVVYTPR